MNRKQRRHAAGKQQGDNRMGQFLRKVAGIRAQKLIQQQHHVDRMNAEIERINRLPMGAPENAHKIDQTFMPVESCLKELEGDYAVDDRGNALIYVDEDECYYPMAGSFRCMCDVFDKLARRFGWPEQPPGMRRLANKLDAQMPLFASDLDGTRETIAWMKEHIKGVTPRQFSEESVEIQIRDELAEELPHA